jgi:putative aldouronate transport system substrate-binding protein
MKKTKILSIMLALALITALPLSACQKSNTTNVAKTSSQSKPVTLNYYYLGDAQPDVQLVQDAMNKILNKKINADISLHAVSSGDYQAKLQIMISAQEDFDMCFTSSWLLNFGQQAAKGAFADITSLLPKYAPKTYASLKPTLWNAAKLNGKIYAVINQQIFARQSGFALSKALVDKYSFDYKSVKKYSDLDPLLASVKAAEPKNSACQLVNIYTDSQALSSFYYDYQWDSIGGTNIPGVAKSTEKNPKVFDEYESQEFKDLITTSLNFVKKGYIPADKLTHSGTWDAGEQVATELTTYKPGIESEMKSQFGGKDVYCVAIGNPLITTDNVNATMTAVSATSKNPERALQALELINTDKQLYNLLCHGIEGIHYTKISDNVIKAVDKSKYNPNSDWAFGNQFNGYLLEGQAADAWDQTKKLNDDATISTLFGFIFNQDNVKTEVANCQAIVKEYIPGFLCGLYGDKTDAKLAEFISKLKAAGMDTLIAEKQKQVDAFIASNK